ncbi:MAG: DEAD/DEAH box helicase [Aeromicrobium sp.]
MSSVSHPVRDGSSRSFSDLSLDRALVDVLRRRGISVPTPVQEAVIPDALAGHHVLGRARTGSGKTLAFGLPILTRLAGGTSRPTHPRGLVLLPTRELANQVAEALEPLASAVGLKIAVVYGGTSMGKQITQLRQGADVVIATPGRLGDLIERRQCHLDAIEVTVLDEADHLCDLGFYKPIDKLLASTPQDGQRLLLSATLDGQVDKLVRRHLPQHRLHEVDPVDQHPDTTEHHLLVAEQTERLAVARDLVTANPRSIVFTRTRRGAQRLAKQLSNGDVVAVDLHGDLSQGQRERNLKRFRSGAASVIVATDVAARGIHIDGIGLVVHYDAPAEPKAFTHRSGRTARAGESGAVVTMTTSAAVDDVLRMQRKAGVAARRHDARRAPRPLTVEALADSGQEATAAPQRVSPSNGNGNGNRNGGRNRNRNRRRRPQGVR